MVYPFCQYKTIYKKNSIKCSKIYIQQKKNIIQNLVTKMYNQFM